MLLKENLHQNQAQEGKGIFHDQLGPRGGRKDIKYTVEILHELDGPLLAMVGRKNTVLIGRELKTSVSLKVLNKKTPY